MPALFLLSFHSVPNAPFSTHFPRNGKFPKLQTPAPYIILRPGKTEMVAMLSAPVGNFSPKRPARVPEDGHKTAARIKEFNLQIRLC